jgi:hypothetical protein
MVIQSIAHGINHDTVELIDITRPEARKQVLRTPQNDLLIVAVPVYMGRVLAMLSEWLHSIKSCNTPTVCLVVYGNPQQIIIDDKEIKEAGWFARGNLPRFDKYGIPL